MTTVELSRKEINHAGDKEPTLYTVMATWHPTDCLLSIVHVVTRGRSVANPEGTASYTTVHVEGREALERLRNTLNNLS